MCGNAAGGKEFTHPKACEEEKEEKEEEEEEEEEKCKVSKSPTDMTSGVSAR